MKKLLFLIHDLGQGGAEKVLVNLVNNMDPEQFDITVMALFGGGVNEQFLDPRVHYQAVFPRMIRGNSHLMKLLSPSALHRLFIREHYDIEIAYLEGPCARIISGCPHDTTKLVSWIHVEQSTARCAARSFRSYVEALTCYNRFHRIVCVSKTVQTDFFSLLPVSAPSAVLYNTIESETIRSLAKESVDDTDFPTDAVKLIGIGTLKTSKGFDRILHIVKRLRGEGYPIRFYLLGCGPEEDNLRRYTQENALTDCVAFLGYQTNPYKYLKRCDLFLCASYSEGFSTAATEALIVGTPVCTVEVSGMREMLGENNEYGLITENEEEALYRALKSLLDEPALLAHYRNMAAVRGESFSTEKTVRAVEELLLSL